MTYTELDTELAEICIKLEQMTKKYNISFMDALNTIMEIHVSWIDEKGEGK